MNLRRQLLAICVVLIAALAAAPAGSKNFTPPSSVPDYFSNESGPFHTGASARTAGPGPAPRFASPTTHSATSVAARRHSRHRPLHAAAPSRRRRDRRLARRKVEVYRHALHARAAHGGRMVRTAAVHGRHETAHRRHELAHRLGKGKIVAARSRHRPAPRTAKRLVRVRG